MIKINGATYERFLFPAGEPHIRLTYSSFGAVDIDWEWSDLTEILDLMLIHNALKHSSTGINELTIYYMPFSRQDRVAVPGECLSIEVMANIINSLNAKSVKVYDPHSDVCTALINNCHVISQDDIFEPIIRDREDFYLISPDGGALKKIYKLAKRVKCIDVIECSKIRDVHTGEISGVRVHANDLDGKDCYIVDDICDGGRTFREIAKELKNLNPGKVTLCVSHGLFTQGLDVFKGLIDEIYTLKGKVM